MTLQNKPLVDKTTNRQGNKPSEFSYVKEFGKIPEGLRANMSKIDTSFISRASVSASGTVATNINPALEHIYQGGLFPNTIDNSREFGISRNIADRFSQAIETINEKTAEQSYSSNDVNPTFRSKKVAIRLIPKNPINSLSEFYKTLSQLTTPKVIQSYLALWDYANLRGSFIFNGTRLTKIMEAVLTNKTGYFTQEQKRDFTTAIHAIRNFEIELDKPIEEKDDRGRKRKMVKRDYVRLIDLTGAVYAKTRDGKIDDSVIVKLYGELLPNFNKGAVRARLYSKGILALDANKDGRAIILGVRLQTRFGQLQQDKGDKEPVIKLKRKTLIEWADYSQTDQTNKSTASDQLTNTLNKLVSFRIIKSFEPKVIPTDDDAIIVFYANPTIENKAIEAKKDKDIELEERVKDLEKTNKYYGVEIPKKQ